MISISLAEKKDAFEIAMIHKQEIKNGFLSSLPVRFLEKMYAAVIENDFCVVAKEDNTITGFIAGTTDVKKLYVFFLKKYFFQSAFFIFSKIFSFSLIKKILENFLYAKKEQDLPKAELLAVAIKGELQGKGVGALMLESFIVEMKKRNISVFKVLVGEELKNAVAFYEKNNFIFSKHISIHGKASSRVYLYNTKNVT